MSDVNSRMQAASQHLEVADTLIKKSLLWIKQQCLGGKSVSGEKLDGHQMASFDLAWCAADFGQRAKGAPRHRAQTRDHPRPKAATARLSATANP